MEYSIVNIEYKPLSIFILIIFNKFFIANYLQIIKYCITFAAKF